MKLLAEAPVVLFLSKSCFLNDTTEVVSRSLVFIMALFHCMVRHGTVWYGSLLGGFPLGTVPGT